MAPERLPDNHYKGRFVDDSPEISQAVTLPKPNRKKGIRSVGVAIGTVLAIQTGVVFDRTYKTDKKIGIIASAGINYSSIAQQVAHETILPPIQKITASPQHEVPPTTEPKKIESPKCDDGWEIIAKGVCFTTFREYDSDIHVVRVDLKDPSVSVRPSFVATPGRLGRLSDGAQKQGAIAAINASFFTGTRALGPIAANGEWLQKDSFPQQVLIVNKDNSAKIMPTEQALTKDPAQMKFAISGSHALLRNGITTANFGPDNSGCVLNCKHPRSAIGINAKGHLYLVVVDGRTRKSRGVTTPELGGVMDKVGADDAIVLDGGSSSGMAINGQVSKGKNQLISTLIGVYTNI